MWIEKILRSPGQDPNCPVVILSAATGKAASLIGNFLNQNIIQVGYTLKLSVISYEFRRKTVKRQKSREKQNSPD